MDAVPLERLYGQGVVLNVEAGDDMLITADHLEKASPAVEPGDIVVIDTGWTGHMDSDRYFDHPSLTHDAAEHRTRGKQQEEDSAKQRRQVDQKYGETGGHQHKGVGTVPPRRMTGDGKLEPVATPIGIPVTTIQGGSVDLRAHSCPGQDAAPLLARGHRTQRPIGKARDAQHREHVGCPLPRTMTRSLPRREP